jgi:colanic acid/amylovoran biosynthesis glycosyltransferase
MCNAIMEAMAAGLTVVTTDIPENHELITHEKTGLLCPVRDTACLTRTLAHLLDHPENISRFGVAAAESVHERYELQTSALRWKRFFLSTTNT